MKQFFEDRPRVLRMLIALIFTLLVGSLFNLTVIDAGQYSSLSTSSKQRTIVVKGQRGKILDANLVPIAVDKTSYNIEFYRDPSRRAAKYRAMYTKMIVETIDIVEENGGKTIDTFSIRRDDKGAFVFDFKTTDAEIAAKREKLWRSNMYLQGSGDDVPSPYECYMELRARYQIPEDMSYEMARKVLSVWQEVQYTFFTSYVPVTVARDVSRSTAAQITSRAGELTGMSAVESNLRTYPKGTSAAHIVGYTGRMQDADQIEQFTAKGYSTEDEIGLSGVEQTMEEYLTANSTEKQGYRVVEVDSSGAIVKELKYVAPESGNDVVLTVDMQLQQKLEQALEENIKQINQKQRQVMNANAQHYLEESNGDLDSIDLAETGAAVVMDVKTGNVLALASYPSFDPNLFVGGISETDYAQYRDDKRSPLFNKAISSKSTPGSIFKLVTGLGGLMEKAVTVNETIDDKGPFTIGASAPGTKAPKCWVAPNYSRHKAQDIVKAVKNSCNYYFMTVAYRMGIDKLNKWGQKLGLTSKTNIELPNEAIGQIGGQEVLYDPSKGIQEQKTSLPYLVQLQIKNDVLPTICSQQDIKADEQTLENCAARLVKLTASDSGTWGPKIRQILREELGISETIANAKGYHRLISSALYQLNWNPTLTATTGFGQGYVTITPIAAARYISALANGGTVYDAHIVDRIIAPDGTVVKQMEPTVYDTLDAPKLYLDKLKEGMHGVVSAEDGGTAGSAFRDFPYELGGKTGTAQVSDIDLEDNSWFVCFAPYDDPQIAVVIFVPHGYQGLLSAYTAKEVIQYYMDKQNGVDDNGGSVTGDDQLTQ